MTETYDVAIIGTGPGGLTAAVYAARYMMKVLLIGKALGGLIAEAHKVCNFPTYEAISGLELTQKLVEQVKALGVTPGFEAVEEITKGFKIRTNKGTYTARKIIYATGTEKRHLGISDELKFIGKGVSYCATCDGPFFKDKIVSVVGGSNSALMAASMLSEMANKVYIIYRRDRFFRGEPAWVKIVEKNPKIETIFNANIKQIKGNNMVESIVLDTGKELELEGIFVEVGCIPESKLAKSLGAQLDNGYVITDRLQRTNVKGFFGVGDVTNIPFKQVVLAAAQGAMAAKTAYDELTRKE